MATCRSDERMKSFLLVIIVVIGFYACLSKCAMTEEQLKQFLSGEYEKTASAAITRVVEANWNLDTDLNNKEKAQIKLKAEQATAALFKEYWEKYFKDLNPDDYQDEQLKRQAKFLRVIGTAALDEDKLTTFTSIVDSMKNIFSTAKICPFSNQKCELSEEGLPLEPEIAAILEKSTDYDELVYVWKAWRDASGAKMRDLFKTYVELSNEAAVANKFKDQGEFWRFNYESETFVQDIDDLWTQVEPLYNELHKYVGNKLKMRYGDKLDLSDGLIPAHVFGNMWAQHWTKLAHLVKPYPDASHVNVNKALLDHRYTVLDMFETANHFYKSMGLLDTSISYNTSAGAMIEKPHDGREVVCHPSASDFNDGHNYRIKMCTKVKFEDFVIVHHEMGHVQYYLQYAKLPIKFRNGANPGFHEAIGDTIGLSASTPNHLRKINLLPNYTDSEESAINALMDMALLKIALLPFGLLVDKWRWDVFSGNVEPENWNAHWWNYKKKYQKIKPPVERSEEDFDPGAKFHVASDSEYIPYFVSCILQFQLYQGLCSAAGEYNPDNPSVPLYNCDFYKSKAAGARLSKGLALGASEHWSDVLEVLTGERKLSAGPLLEYFKPLYNFMKKENSEL